MGEAVSEDLAPAPGAAVTPPVDSGSLAPAPGAPIAPPPAAQANEPESFSDPMAGEISPDSGFVRAAGKVGEFFGKLGATAYDQAKSFSNGLLPGANVVTSAALQHVFTGEPYEQARQRFQAADLSRKEHRDFVGRMLESAAPAVTASLIPGGIAAQGFAAGAIPAVGNGVANGDSAGKIAKDAAIEGTASAAMGKLAELGITHMTNAAAKKIAQDNLAKWANEFRGAVGKDVVLNPAEEIAPGFTIGKAIENYTPLAAKGDKGAQAALIELAKKYGKQASVTADDLVTKVVGGSAPVAQAKSAASKVVHTAMAAGPVVAAATGHVGGAALMAGAAGAAKLGSAGAQRALVALIRAKAAGSVTADMVNEAISLGVPRAAALGASGLSSALMGR